MRITKGQFESAVDDAVMAVGINEVARPRYADAIESALASLGIEVFDVECVWVERTWSDVRQGDVVRPPGVEQHEATVTAIGPVCAWHVNPDSHPRWPTPMEWQARAVTMIPLGKGEESAFTPPNGVDPGASVEIGVTRGELAAIEMLGGWKERVAINESGA